MDDNSFADITFKEFWFNGIKRISSNAFGKAAKTIEDILCYNFECQLQHQPPKYDIWKMLSQMPRLMYVGISVNVSEIPANAIKSVDGHELSKLQYIVLKLSQNAKIKSGAFQNLDNLTAIGILNSTIKFEKESLKFNTKSNKPFSLQFYNCSLTGQSFETGTFNGTSNYVQIRLIGTSINYFPETVFKPILDNSLMNLIIMSNDQGRTTNSTVECKNEKNQWLTNGHFEEQVIGARCKENPDKTLFDKKFNSIFK